MKLILFNLRDNKISFILRIHQKDYWYFYDDATDKWVKGDYSSATVYAVQNEGLPSFTLHVKDKTTNNLFQIHLFHRQ